MKRDTEWCVKIIIFVNIYGFFMLCKKLCMYSCDQLFMHSLECYFGVLFPLLLTIREINTKIALLWVQKQFAIHYSMYIMLQILLKFVPGWVHYTTHILAKY